MRNARNNLQLVSAGLLAGGVYQDKSMALADADGMKVYRREEIAKHTTNEKGVWVTYNGEVYDITKFLPDHPGGKKAPLLLAGGDATEEFDMLHKPEILDKYAGEYLIGTVAESPSSKL